MNSTLLHMASHFFLFLVSLMGSLGITARNVVFSGDLFLVHRDRPYYSRVSNIEINSVRCFCEKCPLVSI